jgi:hypothetical protein
MIEDETPLFESGHNNPPEAMMAAAVQDQRDALRRFEERKAEFIKKAGQKVVRDRQSAADAADIISLAGKVWRMIEAERLERSNPFRETANSIAAVATEFWADVDAAMKDLAARIDAWTEEEDRRIEEQRREQARVLEEMRAAAAAKPAAVVQTDPNPRPAPPEPIPAKRRKIRGDLGGMISAAERKEYELEDWTLLPDWLMRSPTVVNAILTVARQTSKHMGAIPGIKVSTVTENQIR